MDTGEIYVGRTSGYGTPEEVLSNRDKKHEKLYERGFGPAVIDKVATGEIGEKAIRGREQQMIDFYGGALSDSARRPDAISANRIRGVDKNNPRGREYHEAANALFGEKYKYTGN